jgi:mRNA interferase HigB
MKLIGQQVLGDFTRKHADARAWIAAWACAVDAATWRDIDDVRRAYPHADGVKLKSGNVVTVFNCKGNAYRLLCYVAYPVQTVQVLEVLTHAEYSKGSWKARY